MTGPDLALWEGVLRLLLAFGLAALIGVEREIHEQDAGLRTHMLVGTGAALFVLVGNFAWSDLPFGNQQGVVLDPSRVIAYVVTGIGFLGAGAILKHGISVRGLTTAASLWVTAAVGVSAAAGEYLLAVIATGVILVSLWPLRRLAAVAGVRKGGALRLQVELTPEGSVGRVAEALERHEIAITSATVVEESDRRRLELLIAHVRGSRASVLDIVHEVDGVRGAAVAD